MMYNIAYRSILSASLFVLVLSLSLLSGCERGGEDVALSCDDVPSAAVASVSLIASQSGDDGDDDGEQATRVESNLWESSDFIGVSTSDESEQNMCYMVEPNGEMTSTDNEYTISVIGSKSYYAYYPYQADMGEDNSVSIDVSEQSTMVEEQFKALDLMWTKQLDIDAYQPLVYLLFERQMVHVDLTLFIYDDTFDEASGINLNGVYTKGDFNVMTGDMTRSSAAGDLKLRVTTVDQSDVTLNDGTTKSASRVTAEAYILPMDDATITFSYMNGSGGNATCTLNSGDLISGNNYKFNITEGIESYELSQIDGSATPAGNLWVISDSDPAVSSQFGGLRSALETINNTGSSVSLLFLNLSALPSGALRDCTALTAVDMPNVKTLNSYALSGCSSLSDLGTPQLEYVAGYAFEGCRALESVSMTSLNMVGEGAFEGCSTLDNLSFANLESIAARSFANCSALSIFDAPNVSWIGAEAFAGCANLKELTVGNESTAGITNLVRGWVDSSETQDIQLTISTMLPTGLSVSGNELIYANGESDTFSNIKNEALMLSDFTTGMNLSDIPTSNEWILMDSSVSSSSDFAGLRYVLNSLTGTSKSISLVFPNLATLPSGAFMDTQNLGAIDLMNITEIGADVFSGASSLRSITLNFASGDNTNSLDSGWITSAESEVIDLVINSTLPAGFTIQDNMLCLTDDDSLSYFRSINGVGFTLSSFALFIGNDPLALPTTTEWYITESGTPLIAAFDDLKEALKRATSGITLIFAELDGLPNGALSEAENLYKVSLMKATRIYYGALSKCSTLEVVDAPYVTTVSESAFALSLNMKSVSLPSAMVVGSSAFQSMYQLESLDLGSSTYVSYYDKHCFDTMYNLSSLTTLTICGRDKFTSDMSISTSGTSLLFDNEGDEYGPAQISYTFKEIIER